MRVLDFKPANVVQFDLDGDSMTKPEYTTPEMFGRTQTRVAFALDKWSLGMIVFELFAGGNLLGFAQLFVF